MTNKKQFVGVDMDGVIAHFEGSHYFKPDDPIMRSPPRMFDEGFFETLPLIDGAAWGIRALMKNPNLDIHIISQPVLEASESYSEKARWIMKWFPELTGKITLTQNKELLSGPGRILIDDADWKWREKWEEQGGEFVHFNTTENSETHNNPRKRWEIIVNYLTNYYSQKVMQ